MDPEFTAFLMTSVVVGILIAAVGGVRYLIKRDTDDILFIGPLIIGGGYAATTGTILLGTWMYSLVLPLVS